jgi:hypothetical protein
MPVPVPGAVAGQTAGTGCRLGHCLLPTAWELGKLSPSLVVRWSWSWSVVRRSSLLSALYSRLAQALKAAQAASVFSVPRPTGSSATEQSTKPMAGGCSGCSTDTRGLAKPTNRNKIHSPAFFLVGLVSCWGLRFLSWLPGRPEVARRARPAPENALQHQHPLADSGWTTCNSRHLQVHCS